MDKLYKFSWSFYLQGAISSIMLYFVKVVWPNEVLQGEVEQFSCNNALWPCFCLCINELIGSGANLLIHFKSDVKTSLFFTRFILVQFEKWSDRIEIYKSLFLHLFQHFQKQQTFSWGPQKASLFMPPPSSNSLCSTHLCSLNKTERPLTSDCDDTDWTHLISF